MKNLKLLFFMLLCFVIFTVVGCGGSSNHIQNPGNQEITDEDDELDVGISGDVPAKTNDDPEVLRVLDKVFATDENGVPMIFDYAPLPETSNDTYGENGTAINFLKYVSSKDLNENGEFVKTFALEKDNEYIIKYSHSGRNLNGSYLKFRITAPEEQVMILDLIGTGKSSRDEELEAEGVISKSIYVETKHEVIPEESPCIMLYSFKAPLTGTYEFAVRETNPFNLISPDLDKLTYIGIPFEFRFYTAGETYSATDDEEKELSARKILDLQRILLNNATEFDENGLPVAFENNDTYGSDEESTNNYLDSAYGVLDEVYGTNNSDKVIVASRIDNVPYNSLYAPGSGFYAHSGLRSIQLTAFYDDVFSNNAIDDFTIEKPQGNYSMKERLNVDYVSTEEEYLRLKGLDNLSDFTLLKDALDNNMRGSAKLGLAGSKTLNLRYEYYESKPRMPKMEDIRIRSAVVKRLKNDFNSFQREHGDYFVAGYTCGLFYEAVIDIKVEPYNCSCLLPSDPFANIISLSTSQPPRAGFYLANFTYDSHDAEEICNYIREQIEDAFKSTNVSSANNVISSLEDKLKNATGVSISISSVSHSGIGGSTTVSSLRDLVSELYNFKTRAAQTVSSKYERLYATLIRYREIENVKKYIPEELRCYKNAIDSIPASHLNNSEARRIEWNNEFSDVFNLYQNQLNRLCSDINFVRDYYNKFSRLLDKYQGLNHRYVFYRYFLAYQKGVRNGVGNWTDSDDGWRFPLFKVGFSENDVANNKFIKEDLTEARKYDSQGFFWINVDAWTRLPDELLNMNRAFPENTRPYYYEGGPRDTNGSDGTDLRGHSFGKRSYHWKFNRSSNATRFEYKVDFKLINMPPEKYPFVGLED